MKTISSALHSSQRGLALVLILGAILLGTAALMGFLRISQNFITKTQHYSAQTQADLDSQSLADRVRRTIVNIVQTRMSSAQTGTLMAHLTPQAIQTGMLLESSERILEVKCIGQGHDISFALSVCDESQALPKIFEVIVQARDPSGSLAKIVRQEIHIDSARLNNYAFFVKAETADEVTLSSANYSGLFGISFLDPTRTVSGTSTLMERIKLAPTGDEPLTFQKALITNLPSPSTQIRITNTNQVELKGGVISSAGSGLNFASLETLHSRLKVEAINPLPVEVQADSVQCSKVTLSRDASRVSYQMFSDTLCTNSLAAVISLGVEANQSFYARGSKVFLQTEDPDGLTKIDNIAIVADGDIELLSSIRRDPSMPGLKGFPAIISPGDLIISGAMRSLLPGNPNLQTISLSTFDPAQPTIQIDLSYLSLGQIGTGGRFLVDSNLLEATSAQTAKSLGLARFNGMFISDKAPITRLLFSNGKIDGFAQAQWNHPGDLSAVNTDWFSLQLGGGALTSNVVRTELSNLNIAEALRAFGPAVVETDELRPQ